MRGSGSYGKDWVRDRKKECESQKVRVRKRRRERIG